MLLRLQKYDIELVYRKGKEMFIADTLSRAYPEGSEPKTEPQSEFCHQIEELSLTEHLPITGDLLQQLCDETAKDSKFTESYSHRMARGEEICSAKGTVIF